MLFCACMQALALVSACACACDFSSSIAVIISRQYLYFCTSKSSKLGTCLADLFALLLPYFLQIGELEYYQYVYCCTSKASQLRTCLTKPDVSSCFFCLQVGGSEYYEQYSSIYSGAAPEMGSSRNRLSPPKDHHQPPPNGTQFTRFTGTKLHVLTQKALQTGGTPKPCLFLIFFFYICSLGGLACSVCSFCSAVRRRRGGCCEWRGRRYGGPSHFASRNGG